MKKPTFTTHNYRQERPKAASTTRCGFFVDYYFQVIYAFSGVIAYVTRNQSWLPLSGIVRIVFITPLFLFLAYQGGKDYIYVHCIKSTNKMHSNKNNGLPTGEPHSSNAELRQLLKGYLKDIGGIDSLKDDVFQLMESLVASMETLGLDSGTALHYFFICRCTVDLITDLEYLLLQSSNSSQSCSN